MAPLLALALLAPPWVGVYFDGPPGLGWGELVELAFTEIIVFGVDSPQIVRRLLAAFDDLEQLVPPELHGPVAEERDQLRAAAERRLPAGVDRRTVLSPNRRGMG